MGDETRRQEKTKGPFSALLLFEEVGFSEDLSPSL